MSRNALPEKYHVGFQDTGTVRAGGYAKSVDAVRFDVGISVGRDHGAAVREMRIFRLEHPLNRFPRMVRAAIKAADSAEVAVQLDDVDASGSLVETVDILRDELS